MKNKKLLFTGGGGVFSETIWRELGNKYDIYFADVNPKKIFYKIPNSRKLKIGKGNSKKFITSLKSLIKKYNFDLIIPNVDEEIFNIINSKFNKKKIFLPPASFCKITLNKLVFFEYLKKNHLENLDTFRLDKFRKYNKYKTYLIKPIYGRGSRYVKRINREKDIKKFLAFYKLDKKDLLIQNFVKGNEYTVFVHTNNKNNIIIPVRVYQKKGITIDAQIEKNKIIEKYIKTKILKVFTTKNCFNVQLILKGKKVYIIEINPRLSTTFALIVKSGYDPFSNSFLNKFILKKEIKMRRYLTARYY
ncbi:ATP-grasp domain-containing protein [Candidatus Pelagibacter sp.]|uniref:ATP-grasp domain-containing protein n=1 Tax=Candidatus Pelagibacter sp. TaxID=2024849 RepID=UPI003F875594